MLEAQVSALLSLAGVKLAFQDSATLIRVQHSWQPGETAPSFQLRLLKAKLCIQVAMPYSLISLLSTDMAYWRLGMAWGWWISQVAWAMTIDLTWGQIAGAIVALRLE